MTRWKLGAVLGVMFVMLALGPALADSADEGITVGEFLREIAHARQLSSASAQEAAASLRANGFDIPRLVLADPLTEKDVVAIAKSFGLPITSNSPETRFTRRDATEFLGTFSRELGLPKAASSGVSFGSGGAKDSADTKKANPLLKGKGKKKGLNKRSPSDPI